MRKFINATISGALLLTIISASAAIAGDLPNYPVEAWCNKIASAVGAKSEMLYGGCISQEQSAYDSLKTVWADLPQRTKTWCDQIAKSTGGSYLVLKGCLDQEDSARRQNSTREFQR